MSDARRCAARCQDRPGFRPLRCVREVGHEGSHRSRFYVEERDGLAAAGLAEKPGDAA